ncbi:MAG: flavin reductase family protein [Zavarzinia sp.]|nr:flavin reductase family protein [Zavarzinia sp.]
MMNAPQAPAPCDRKDFMDAMSNAATGVGIVTTDGPAGRFGITVSSMASVSADPPLVLACIRAGSPVAAAIVANGCLALNLLDEGQAALADCFAGRPGPAPAFDFDGADWSLAGGPAPLLEGAVAAFSCRLHTVHQAGSHLIVIGLVLAARHRAGTPLLHVNRRYGIPADARLAATAG